VRVNEPCAKPAETLPTTTSVPVAVPEKQESLFREVLMLLEKHRVPYAVAGAFALQKHTGICRFTKDLDIFLTNRQVNVALEQLAKEGFKCEVPDAVWLAKAHRDGFFVDLITGMSNAAIVVDDSWIAAAKRTTVLGVESRVLAPEELLASKLFVTRRERFDGADVVHLIYGTRGQLDWERILRLAGEHWEILLWALVLFRYVYPGQSDYVPRPLWEDLLARFSSRIAHPDPGSPFRGSLIDENMFAIDVNEWGLRDMLTELRFRRLREMQDESKSAAQ
jgi:hypothetical protein